MTSPGRHPRPLLFGLLTAALLAGTIALARADTALRGAVTVNAASVRVGDLFSGAGGHAGEIVATAPAPGARVLFDASWLAATAQAHGLNWQPADDSVSIAVTRAATLVTGDAVTQPLLRALAPGSDAARLSLDQRVELYAPVGSTDPAVSDLQVDPVSGRFSADLRIAGDDPGADPVHVTGRLVNVVQLPTLMRPMMPGEVVGPDDIAWTTVDVAQMPAGELSDVRDLIGHTPRHPLRAREPLRPFDLEMPLLVHRNDAVLIVLQAPGMTLTAAGKALDDGGRGELIRVVNVQSNRTIDATVAAPGQVELGLPGAQPPLL